MKLVLSDFRFGVRDIDDLMTPIFACGLVWPVHRCCSCPPSDKDFLTRLFAGILAAFGVAVLIRFLFLNGGAVRHSHLFPPFELVWSYLALLPFYLVAPFTSMSTDWWALLAGLLVVVGTGVLLLFQSRDRGAAEVAGDRQYEPVVRRHLILLGAGMLILGMLPYQLAGYGSFGPRLVDTLTVKCGLMPEGDLSWYNFSWASRIYSSASFGVAILLAMGLAGGRKPSVRLLGKIVAVVLIGFMAIFHAGLSQDWREAAEIRNDLVRSLVSQVPAVRSDTNFVFLDLACSHKRAEVIRLENDGLRELIWMLYADQSLRAWRLYPHAYDRHTHVYQQAVVMPEGFLSGGSQRQNEPAPPDSLLLFKRVGRELVLLDRITAHDGSVPTGIVWRGTEHLKSNLGRIEACRAATAREARLARNVWTSGLFSTLQLSRLKTTLSSLRGARYRVVHNMHHRRFFKMRLSGVETRR